ncbi:UEV-domain-containing protein [Neurospora crassa]|uniref:ESCRT-I component n=1 Tax=Neurospora crassa (strain ATCC 24698 / 74-OR23-1A / CBS 708.71 / DSM 1257 / FGSC 987) TaxID=367110 RepID=Q7S4R9_NEUCR|nr:ESCRT-I component [Neurospora crassa OR74A]EAA30492.1 ESCRT-I component [Neurospora crassa OR74A]KHE86672.1 UEV-domain-containing protein [Neurospora crassa]|eukprot:XP_959728.1 ESCRT-I component [Neurospora crassa OR74A]
MVVQQHILNWLYSVLTSEYHDVNRTYNDVAQVLSHYPSLSPRTDVHTFPNGASALLVHLSGTLPVVFRGTTYRFPISVWIPHAYPREAPLVYVTPTEHIMVRPGQHVDPQGQVYHPYLAGWSTYWDKSTILDFLAILRDVFAKEPPVIARPPPQGQVRSPPPQQQQQPQPPQAPGVPTPPPVPPLPQELAARSPVPVPLPAQQDGARPPPPPPKPGAPAAAAPIPQHQPSPAPSYAAAPPVPPHPPHPGRPTSQHGGPGASTTQSPRPGPSRYDAPPPLPPHPTAQQQQQQQPPQPPHGAPYQSPPPVPAALPHNQAPPQPPFSQMDPRRMSTLQQHTPQHYASPPNWQQQQYPPQASPPPHQQHQFPPQPQPKPPPPPDLLDDDTPASPPSSTPGAGANATTTTASPDAPPPPPPNPEKDALLRQLASTLYTHRQHARAQNDSSLAGLQAQRTAMDQAATTLQAEYAQLSQLSALLTSNTDILQESLRKADAVIENSKTLKEPDIDELLVAPTVVGNQLYELVAEERALADAIFMLGRAVERGRIAPGTHAKMVRGLAREWYLKKALVKKIGDGMGLSQ